MNEYSEKAVLSQRSSFPGLIEAHRPQNGPHSAPEAGSLRHVFIAPDHGPVLCIGSTGYGTGTARRCARDQRIGAEGSVFKGLTAIDAEWNPCAAISFLRTTPPEDIYRPYLWI